MQDTVWREDQTTLKARTEQAWDKPGEGEEKPPTPNGSYFYKQEPTACVHSWMKTYPYWSDRQLMQGIEPRNSWRRPGRDNKMEKVKYPPQDECFKSLIVRLA